MEWVVSCVVRNAGWILLLLLVQTLMVAEARTRDYVRPRYTFIPWSMEFGSRGAQSTATTIMAKRPSRWTQLKIQTIRTDERRRKKSDSERRLLLLLLRALLAAAGCRWWQLHIITVPLILRTNKRQKLRQYKMVLDSDFLNIYFIFHVVTCFTCLQFFHKLFVCLLLVTESHGQSNGASRDSELRLLAELSYLINNSECFETLTTKPPTDIIFFSKLIIPFFNCVGTWHSLLFLI